MLKPLALILSILGPWNLGFVYRRMEKARDEPSPEDAAEAVSAMRMCHVFFDDGICSRKPSL